MKADVYPGTFEAIQNRVTDQWIISTIATTYALPGIGKLYAERVTVLKSMTKEYAIVGALVVLGLRLYFKKTLESTLLHAPIVAAVPLLCAWKARTEAKYAQRVQEILNSKVQ
jgi:hypothetical protein